MKSVLLAALLLSGGRTMVSALDVPVYDHVVVVVEENRSLRQVRNEPYIASLIRRGLLLTNSHAVAHPSEPNYIALFSGSTWAITDDGHYDLAGPNLALSLMTAGFRFAGYSEGLPAVGYRGDTFNGYARKHAPWAAFTNLPGSVNLPFSRFPSDFNRLPALSFVIPNLYHDMHDGSASEGDSWLRDRMDRYVRWAEHHNSLFVLTFDECPGSEPVASTPILTLFVGAHLPAGTTYPGYFDHYSMLRTFEAIFGLPPVGKAAERSPLEIILKRHVGARTRAGG